MGYRTFLITLVLLLSASLNAQNEILVELWQKKMPGDNGDDKDVPFMKIFKAEKKRSVGRTILIIPGDRYDSVDVENDGYAWVPYLNKIGVSVAVLKYRLPHGECEVPLDDAKRAMTILRECSSQWGLNPKDIGVMGFSAGGHIAACMCTLFKGSEKPDFQILFYPVITMIDDFADKEVQKNFLGESNKKKTQKKYSCDMHVSRMTPRALIMLSDDDTEIIPSNGVNYYNELYRYNVPASLHVFPSGGHGWGMDEGFDYHLHMEMLLETWLKSF